MGVGSSAELVDIASIGHIYSTFKPMQQIDIFDVCEPKAR